LIQIVSAKLYAPVPGDVLDRMNRFIALGLAANGHLPSPYNYAIAGVGFMEEVNVTAVIYNNGSQVFSKGLRPISKHVMGTFSIVDAVNFKTVSVASGGAETSFNATFLANTFAVLVRAGLAFCSSNTMQVAIMVSFSIPGEFLSCFSFTYIEAVSLLAACIERSCHHCIVLSLTLAQMKMNLLRSLSFQRR